MDTLKEIVAAGRCYNRHHVDVGRVRSSSFPVDWMWRQVPGNGISDARRQDSNTKMRSMSRLGGGFKYF